MFFLIKNFFYFGLYLPIFTPHNEYTIQLSLA